MSRCTVHTNLNTIVINSRHRVLHNSTLVHEGASRGLNTNLYRGMPQAARAESCIACRECEQKCPQGIKISSRMPEEQKTFEEKT